MAHTGSMRGALRDKGKITFFPVQYTHVNDSADVAAELAMTDLQSYISDFSKINGEGNQICFVEDVPHMSFDIAFEPFKMQWVYTVTVMLKIRWYAKAPRLTTGDQHERKTGPINKSSERILTTVPFA